MEDYNLCCGVTLTRPDYYTIPPLRELHKYVNDKGECSVTGFVIGRVGYGRIRFLDAVDVADLNLDRIVSLELGEVALYDDEESPPVIGEGLNRRACVELDRLWPRDGERRLRSLSEQQNVTFLDYRHETGTLSIAVEHFSKYSYKDSDGDCEVVTSDLDKEMQQMEEDLEQLKQLEEASLRRGLGGIRSSEPFDQSSFIVHPSRPSDAPTFARESKPLYIAKSSFFDEDSISDDMSSCDVGVHLSIQNSSTCTSNASEKMNVYASDGLIKRYTLLSRVKEPATREVDDVFGQHAILADMTLFKGRSFKVGWGPGMKMITLSSKARGTNLIGEPRCVDFVDVASDVLGMRGVVELEGHLNVSLNSCTITTSQTSEPSCTVKSGWETLVQHQMIAKQLSETSPRNNLVNYYNQTWELCLALWGPEAVTSSAKRELFSSWLQTIVRHDGVDVGPLGSDREMILGRIFVHLLSHQIYEASQLAMSHDMPTLGILIAQTQQSTRNHIATQIEQWQDRGVMNFISGHIKKVYALLGGLPIIADVNVLDGLKWKRILALYLWYICPPGVLLDEAVTEYTNAFEKNGVANYPVVEHNALFSELVYDTQFQLLQLNHKAQDLLNKVLNPAGHTSSICDYRFSWLLLQVLTSLKIGSLPSSICDAIHIRFATQLEAMGLWKWAAFAVLFVREATLKRNQLTSILERNLEVDDNDEIVQFLVDSLKIPPSAIHAVLAQKTESAGEFIVSFRHHLLAKNWRKAHDLCVARVIPDLILREEFDLLLRFLNELFAETTQNPQSSAAGLIYEFLLVCKRVDDVCDDGEVGHKRYALVPEVISIINRLKHSPATEPRQFLAKLEVARHLKHILGVACYGYEDPTVASSYQQLALPFDYEYTMSMWKS
ncbi:hypothetical protein PPYR_02896 [Photinus pyralis]|uniref:Nuclear pore complex protein Nup98-Nup96 n=1 Tax=Photinus pyralis TaxID=7054 RepID=A0A5N4A1B8_PHOPY|nr:nuclear pore complex protein Nup98-Nup96-like [Photinus pyralis]KAB0791096.1 hypothetical protein PPYR_02896 [Photinus pyralis]